MRSKLVLVQAVLAGLGLVLVAPMALAGPPTSAGEIFAKYYEDLSGSDLFQVDLNGNFAWNGTGGGDGVTFVAPGQGPGLPLVGDGGELCKSIGTLLFCDRNRNGVWEGNAGGDLATNFSPGAGTGVFLFADTTGDGVKEIVKYLSNVSGIDVFQVDANQNNVWNGTAGGDAVVLVAPGAGPGVPFACDCDGDGTQELGKVITSSSTLFVDLNNNGIWEGNAGGDLASGFAGGAGAGRFVFANVNGSAGDDAAKYYDNLSGNDLFQVDLNGNWIWNGTAGGDGVTFIAPGAGAGDPCAIDPDGDGTSALCKTNALSQVFADLNGNGMWDGNGGGDLGAAFAAGAGTGTFVVTTTPAP